MISLDCWPAIEVRVPCDHGGMVGGPARTPAISAHRGGSEEGPGGTYETYLYAVAAGADYVEFDVRQTRDGTLVALHDGRAGRWGRPVAAVSYSRLCELTGHQVPRIAEVMRLLAGRAVAHVDLKDARCAPAVVRLGLDLLGPAGMIVTTGENAVLARVRRQFPGVPVGLTIGGGRTRTIRPFGSQARESALAQVELTGAGMPDWVVLQHRLARVEVLRQYRHWGIKTMIWTVNTDRDLARWVASPSVDALVTDRPARALALRGQLASRCLAWWTQEGKGARRCGGASGSRPRATWY
jgi:glycerophosphoryl diester phosphodiesterase